MEIFIKADDKTHKINWLSSIPDKYKKDILRKVKEEVVKHEITNADAAKAPRHNRRRSQEASKRDMSQREISKLKGLLGFQGANYIDANPKDGTDTFEVILNIKANKATSSKIHSRSTSKMNLQSISNRFSDKGMKSKFMSRVSSLKAIDTDELPNLLRINAKNDTRNKYGDDLNQEYDSSSSHLEPPINCKLFIAH